MILPPSVLLATKIRRLQRLRLAGGGSRRSLSHTFYSIEQRVMEHLTLLILYYQERQI